jgi:hypothetical protein
MVIKATLLNLRIAEVPTTLSPDGRTRRPHLRPWRDGWRHLRFMLLYSPRWLFLYPGVLLMSVGLIMGGWLLPGPRHVGGVTLDIHTLLAAAIAVLVGFQTITFAVFSRIFAASARLMPPSARLNSLFRYLTLEVGLAAGALLVAGGLAGVGFAFYLWESQAFGPMNPSELLRWLIPSGTALAIGCQALLSSFFLSVLGLRTRNLGQP